MPAPRRWFLDQPTLSAIAAASASSKRSRTRLAIERSSRSMDLAASAVSLSPACSATAKELIARRLDVLESERESGELAGSVGLGGKETAGAEAAGIKGGVRSREGGGAAGLEALLESPLVPAGLGQMILEELLEGDLRRSSDRLRRSATDWFSRAWASAMYLSSWFPMCRRGREVTQRSLDDEVEVVLQALRHRRFLAISAAIDAVSSSSARLARCSSS